MKFWNFFNKQRISVGDLRDMQTWTNENSTNRTGMLMSKGLIKNNINPKIGYSGTNPITHLDVNYPPADWTITQSSGIYTLGQIDILVPSNKTLMAIDSLGNVISIIADEPYKTAPTSFQSRGNTNIPLSSGTGFYYVWVCNKVIYNSNYNRVDKNGVAHYPEQIIGYDIVVTFNATSTDPYTTSGIMPTGDYLLIGEVYYDDSAVSPTPAMTMSYSYVKYASIYSQNIGIEIDTSSPPTTYADGDIKDLSEHINALGNGTISPTNPHAVDAIDVNALSATGLGSTTNYGLFRNGLLSKLNTEYTSNTTEWQAKLYNTTPHSITISGILTTFNNYIKVLAPSNSQFIWDGTLHSITELDTYDSATGAAYANFTSGTAPTAGWYAIYITTSSTPAYPFKLTFTPATPSFYQTDNDPNIYLGYVI
jgi:hypothetical protein